MVGELDFSEKIQERRLASLRTCHSMDYCFHRNDKTLANKYSPD